MILKGDYKMKQDTNYSTKFSDYVENYIKNECDGEIFKLTALIGFSIGGAGKSNTCEYYSTQIKCLAYATNDNKVIEEKINLLYYLDNTSPLKYLQIKELTVYNFLVKKIKDKNLYYLVRLLDQGNTTIFDSIIEQYSKPLTISSDNFSFVYNRTYDCYDGKVILENKNISLSLYPEPDTTDATISLNTFNIIKNNFLKFYHNILLQCSKNLVKNANNWRDENDTHIITEEEIFNKIDCNNFEMEIRRKRFLIYFNDNGLFCGHTISYKGNIENDKFNVTIEG